jgi:hypothetical protein
VYHVDPDALAIVRAYFDSFWKRSLASFERVVQRTEETP